MRSRYRGIKKKFCKTNINSFMYTNGLYRVVQKVMSKRHLRVCQIMNTKNYTGTGGGSEAQS